MNELFFSRFALRSVILATWFFFGSVNYVCAMESTSLEDKLAFLEQKEFVNTLFEKYQRMMENFSAGIDDKHDNEVLNLTKDNMLFINKYSDSRKRADTRDPDVQFAIFLVTLALGDHENEALALLESNSEWAKDSPLSRRDPQARLKVGITTYVDKARIAEKVQMWGSIYIMLRAISAEYMRVAQFLIKNVPQHWLFTEHFSIKEAKKSVFETLLEKKPWDFIENLSAYNLKFEDLVSHDAVKFLSTSTQISEEDFLPGGRGHDLAFKWCFNCNMYELRMCTSTVKSLEKIIKGVHCLRGHELLPTTDPIEKEEKDWKEKKYYKFDATKIDSNVLKECLKRSHYDQNCYQNCIEKFQMNAEWSAKKQAKCINKKEKNYQHSYLEYLIEAKGENKEPAAYEVFAETKIKKVETIILELQNSKEHSNALIRVFEQKPNLQTQVIHSLTKKLLKLGSYNAGDETFKSFSEYSSIVTAFLNAEESAVEISNEYFPNSDSNGVTRILWSEVNLGTRRFTSSPREFIELLVKKIEL